MRQLGCKRIIARLLLSTILLTVCHAAPATANLLTNPGFETGNTTGWTPSSGAASASSFPAVVHDGSWGGFLNPGVTSPGNSESLIQSVSLPGPGTYQFGGWLRAFTVGSEAGVFDQIQLSTFVSITSEGSTLGASVANFSNFQGISFGPFTRASDWNFFSGSFTYTGPANGVVLVNFNLQNNISNVVSGAAGDSFFLEK